HRAIAGDLEHAVLEGERGRPSLDADSTKLEELGDRRARFTAEDRQRVLLRRHDHELDAAGSVVAQVGACLKSEARTKGAASSRPPGRRTQDTGPSRREPVSA